MWRKNLILLVASSILSVLALELGIRLLAPADYRHQRYWRSCQVFGLLPGALSYDPRLGFFHNPNLDLRFKNAEFDTRVRTNSRGFRDDEESLAEPRVLFLGDSFCFGWGVDQEETCENVFQERSGYGSLNMGVAGYSTVQEDILYKGFCETFDIRNATVVLLAFSDDPVGNSAAFRTHPRLRKNGAVISFASPAEESLYLDFIESQRKPWLRRLSRFSCLGDFAIQLFYRPENRMKPFMDLSGKGKPQQGGMPVPPFESFEYVLREMISFSDLRSNRLIVALVPRLEDLLDRPNEEYRAIEAILSRMNVSWVRLADSLNSDDYYPLDRHWNANGHRAVAEAIHRFLKP
jgi:hypothetical protein